MFQYLLNLPLATQLLLEYLLLLNIISFFYIGFDKLKAQLAHRRVREITLWILALIGGSLGIILGMHFFRHKTQKLSFQAVLAVILAAQVLIGYFFLL